MTAQQPATGPNESPGSNEPPKDPTTVWKVLTAVLAVVAIGLGIWAVSLNQQGQDDETAAASEIATLEQQNTDLTEQVATLEDQVSTLEDQTATLEQENADLESQSEQAGQEATAALTQAVESLGIAANLLQVSEQQVSDASTALDEANDALAGAEGDLETAQAQRDQAIALAENAQLCAAGSLQALTLVGQGDTDGAVAELDRVAPACEAAFDEANQPT